MKGKTRDGERARRLWEFNGEGEDTLGGLKECNEMAIVAKKGRLLGVGK